MKNFIITTSLLLLFFLASCRGILSTPKLVEKVPDTLSKSTQTILTENTVADLPRGTFVVTEPTKKTNVTLVNATDTTVVIIPPNEEPKTVILPKNTEILLPESTTLVTTEPFTSVTIQGNSKVTLPPGTEISITKINWYAILFYSFAVIWVGWLFFKKTDEDKNKDGFVDEIK